MKAKNTLTTDAQPAKNATQTYLPTGVANLDEVLGGGLSPGALVLIMGLPGSGKTTLANQIAFAAARRGQTVLILTALSEPTSKIIAHLSTFTFFDQALVGGNVQFMSLQNMLPHGLKVTSDEVVAMARSIGAGMIVLDGFRGMRGTDGSPQEARQFLYDVGATLGTLGVTTLITSEADPRDPTFFPETTAADVILGMHYALSGVRQRRGIEVVKARGTSPLAGLHGIDLTVEGVKVYPQLEGRVARALRQACVAETHTVADARARQSFGLPDLDALLDGGIPRGTSTLIAGSPGVGKSLLALYFALAGSAAGERTVYLSFREDQPQLQRLAAPFTIGDQLATACADGSMTFLYQPTIEIHPDAIADMLLTTLDRVQPQRLVIDSIAEWAAAVTRTSSAARLDDYLTALLQATEIRRLTTVMTHATTKVIALSLDVFNEPLAMLAENMLILQQIPLHARLQRVVSVAKMRYSRHDDTLRAFDIVAPTGLQVLAPFAGGAEIPTEHSWHAVQSA